MSCGQSVDETSWASALAAPPHEGGRRARLAVCFWVCVASTPVSNSNPLARFGVEDAAKPTGRAMSMRLFSFAQQR